MNVPDAVWLQLTPRADEIAGKVWVRWLDVVTMRDFNPSHDTSRRRFTRLTLSNNAALEVRETPQQVLAEVRRIRASHAPLT